MHRQESKGLLKRSKMGKLLNQNVATTCNGNLEINEKLKDFFAFPFL